MTPFSASMDRVTEPEWNAMLPGFADANLYQTWAYGAVSWGERQLSHLVLRQGTDVVAAAQLRIVKLPLVNTGVAYLRWGPLWQCRNRSADSTVLREILAALRREFVEKRGLLLRLLPPVFETEPTADVWRQALNECGLQRDDQTPGYRTIRVDLTPAPEVIRKRVDGKWRNQLNAAERNGLEVMEGTGDDLYAQFLALYREMMARKQFETSVDPEEFQRIQQHLPEAQKMWVLISAKDGVPQTGLVATAVGETGIYLLGATSDAGMKSKGSYLLQWRMMQHLRERDCRWYDLGGINPESNPGVYHFKAGMGGEEVTALGRYELHANRLSSAAVRAGERLRSFVAKLRR
jgi:lipid II:glycine glycyltransferase (peptidoglycan interpeptide bridge formation enzyme)